MDNSLSIVFFQNFKNTKFFELVIDVGIYWKIGWRMLRFKKFQNFHWLVNNMDNDSSIFLFQNFKYKFFGLLIDYRIYWEIEWTLLISLVDFVGRILFGMLRNVVNYSMSKTIYWLWSFLTIRERVMPFLTPGGVRGGGEGKQGAD